jgi:hypothetical protein
MREDTVIEQMRPLFMSVHCSISSWSLLKHSHVEKCTIMVVI